MEDTELESLLQSPRVGDWILSDMSADNTFPMVYEVSSVEPFLVDVDFLNSRRVSAPASTLFWTRLIENFPHTIIAYGRVALNDMIDYPKVGDWFVYDNGVKVTVQEIDYTHVTSFVEGDENYGEPHTERVIRKMWRKIMRQHDHFGAIEAYGRRGNDATE